MRTKPRKQKIGMFGDLKQSLSGALAYEQGKKVALRVTELPPPPKPLTPSQIRAIRQSFNVSQAVFAGIINVSPNAVESWKQGARRPREATLKLLTIAHKYPEVLLVREDFDTTRLRLPRSPRFSEGGDSVCRRHPV